MNQYAEHLSRMVQFATVSNADRSKVDYTRFEGLHAYLQDTYPLVHQRFTREVLPPANLLYHFSAKNPAKPPVLLMSHQDVVPAGDSAAWEYPPFSGAIVGDRVWGRGSNDVKCCIMAHMEALEALLARGWEPDYDIWLAYSCDEEIQYPDKGAKAIVALLQERRVRLGVVLDEGGEIDQKDDSYTVNLYVGEKAYQDFEFVAESPGGHSMLPGKGTALGLLARAIVAIEEHPLPYQLTDCTKNQLSSIIAALDPETAADPEERFDRLCAIARENKLVDALLHTTCAMTMCSASEQVNLLPARARAVMNCRVLEGDTAESLLARFRALVPEGVTVNKLIGDDPNPASPIEGHPYEVIRQAAETLYGKKVTMAPGLLTGATDSRFYTAVCDRVYRFGGMLRTRPWGPAHAVNEWIGIEALEGGVNFFRTFLEQY